MRAISLCILLFPVPATAQTHDLPKGCTAFLTIQGQGCQVRHLWTCTSDTEGEFWFASMGTEGVSVISQLSYGSTNLYTAFPQSGGVETLTTLRDPVDFDTIVTVGNDAFDYDVVDETGATLSASGTVTLIGDFVEIDGRSLQQFERRFVLDRPGEDDLVAITTGFVDTELHTFITGKSWREDDPKNIFDRTPVDFIFPGEPGFMATIPLYGCGG